MCHFSRARSQLGHDFLTTLIPPESPARPGSDPTPPELVDFTIAPLTFDSSAGAITLDWCLTARDDFAGLDRVILINVGRVDEPGQGLPGQYSTNASFSPAGVLESTLCGSIQVPMGAPAGRYIVTILINDLVDNRLTAAHPDNFGPGHVFIPPGEVDLCSIGPCELEGVQPDIDVVPPVISFGDVPNGFGRPRDNGTSL